MYTWEDLFLFFVWGAVCYFWGVGERKYKSRSYQPAMPTKKPNGPSPPQPPTPFCNYNGPPPKGAIKPLAPPSPPPLNNMCKGGWNSPPTIPRPINPPSGQGRKDN